MTKRERIMSVIRKTIIELGTCGLVALGMAFIVAILKWWTLLVVVYLLLPDLYYEFRKDKDDDQA